MIHILTPNDTIVLSDSIINKMAKSTDIAMSYMNNSMSNWADVRIAQCISCAIVRVVFICVVGYVILKIIDAIINYLRDNKKRESEVDDKERGHKSELLSQKLEFLKDLCYIQKNDDKEKKCVKELKGLKSEEINTYISELNKALGISETESKTDKSDNLNTDNNDQQ